MIRNLWHIGLVVSDLERAIAFYRDGLGMTLRHRQEQANEYTSRLVGYEGASLKIAQMVIPGWPSRSGHMVELIEYLFPLPDSIPPENSRIGAAHLALEVESIDALRPGLEAAGARFISDPLDITAGINRGGRTVYLRDPDGITLELCEPPAVPAG